MTDKPPPQFDMAAFSTAIAATLRNVAAVLIAMGVLGSFGWRLASPSVDAYFAEKLDAQAALYQESLALRDLEAAEIRTDIARLIQSVDALTQRIPAELAFIEFQGGGKIMGTRHVFSPGDEVPLLYLLRRNTDCPGVMQVQFYDSEANSIVARYTYDIPMQQAMASFGFQYFPVRVYLPENMRPGTYSYIPRAIPDRAQCPAQREVVPPPSDFFEVVSGGSRAGTGDQTDGG